jgi:hypothetical protein
LENREYSINKLSRREFANALQKGLGRAYVHAVRYGIDEVSYLVLKACLRDQASDPQSEHSKAKYLFAMFKNTKHLPSFKNVILNALKTKRNTWDVQLLFELALQMAKAGDLDAQGAIRDKALKKAKKRAEDGWLGAQELISISGIDGALALARIYGSRLLKDAEDFVPEDEIFPNEEIKNEFRNLLLDSSRNEAELKAYWDYLDNRGFFEPRVNPFITPEARHQRRKQAIRKRHNLESILKDANNKTDKIGARYNQFGWAATSEELEIVYDHLIRETDEDVIWRLLNVFSRVPLPGLDAKLFLWARSRNPQVRQSAIRALAKNNDEKIHALAREKVQTVKLIGPDSGDIELFVKNYKHEDAKLIIDALYRNRPNRNDAHSLAWDIIDLSKNHPDISLGDALRWSYEKTPCSSCRFRIVKQLDLLGQFEGKILYECQFDGNDDIVELARNKIGLSPRFDG